METFKQIQNFPDYQIGEFGTVKSLKNGKERLLSPTLGKEGYLQFGCFSNGVRTMFLLHRLVAIHFIPNPEGKPTVNHKDGNKLNCRKDNLEWSTSSENMQHAYDTGLKVGTKDKNSKLSVLQVQELRVSKLSRQELAKMFSVSVSQIRRIQLNLSR